jgi:hypothetical protein
VIRITHGAYGRLAKLECDSCGNHLGYSIAIEGQGGANIAQREKLREEAQQAGWTFILVSVRSDAPRDLCPNCFTLPPEG